MQVLNIDDLRTAVLPSRLPAATEMGVWKRSTGYEVILPYRRGWLYWLMHLGGIAALAVAATAVGMSFPGATPTERALLYGALTVPLLAYVTFFVIRLLDERGARVRIDMTSMTLTVTDLRPDKSVKRIRKIPVDQVEQLRIDERRGINAIGKTGELRKGVWLARGLSPDDLYYLALLIGKVTTLPAPKSYLPDDWRDPYKSA